MSEPLPPIRLRSVTIKDFRGIDELTIKMPPDDEERAGALVIAGDNGVGKTSVLEAILILFGRVDLLPADTASPSELVRQGASDFEISGNFSRANSFQAWKANRSALKALDKSLGGTEAASSFGRTKPKATLDEALNELQWGCPIPSVYAIESFSSRREPEDLGSTPTDARGARSTREERRLAELKRRLANTFAQSRGPNATFDRINTFMRSFIGERWTLDVVFRSDELGSEPEVVVRDGPLPSASLTLDAIRSRAALGEKMPKVIPIDRLSAGQIALLAITYPFVFADRVPDLVLFDEPEQHLHVSWQGTLLGALRRLSPTTQFIVATHSPWVLDSVPSYERHELVRDDDPRAAETPA
jgi:hypothetical protein